MKKKVFTILLAVIMAVVFMPIVGTQKAYATDKTADQAIEWAKSQVGHSVGYNDGSGYYQCVEFIQAYYQYLGVSPVGGSGYQYATNALPTGWTRTPGGVPQKGDILVYSQYSASVQQYGHVAIYESDNSLYDQDGSVYGATVKNERKNYRTYTYNYWGCIHPNFSNTSHNPIGTFDVAEGKCGEVFVRGWAFDPDNKNQQLEVDLYIGGPAGTGEGHAIIANTERPDVNNVYGCGNYHGFNTVITTNKTGSQTIYAYALNVGEGGHSLIGTKTVNISDPNPTGTFDSAEGGCGSVTVNGWAFDPSDTSKPIDIHVYIGGPTGTSGTEGHNGIVANTKRPDVNNVYKCGDYHGFSATIPTNKTGQQTVYVYGINIGNGWVNPCIGSKTVTIKSHSLVKTPAKAATTNAEGNIEYWTCSGCGKTFKDSTGKTEISKADTVVPKLTPAKTSATPQSTVKTDLPAVTITSAKSAKKAAVVRWKKVSKKNQKKIAKIQIQYSTDKKFKKSVKTVSATKSATYKKIKKLKSKKQYYFRVRSYKKAGNVTHVSKWSKVKKAKIK